MPVKEKYLELLEKFVFPIIKNKNLKIQSSNFKTFLIKICEIHSDIVIVLLKYLWKSWPTRYPEKVLYYFEILENVKFIDFRSSTAISSLQK
jgi:hypothetical protein